MIEGSVKVSEFGMATHASPWMSYMDIKAWLYLQVCPDFFPLEILQSLQDH